MTYWYPDTCNCICIIESKTLLAKCDTHNTFNDVVTENSSFNLEFGNSPTNSEINLISERKHNKLLQSSKAVLTKTLTKKEIIDLLTNGRYKDRLLKSELSKLI